jgi:hypothetical protein
LEQNLIGLRHIFGGAPWERRTSGASSMKIMKYGALARDATDPLTTERIRMLVAELEQKLRLIDE